jgi:acid-sensing ion channel, other
VPLANFRFMYVVRVNVHHIVCYETPEASLEMNSFEYHHNSDFVKYLKSIESQRTWFSWHHAQWNSEEIPAETFAETFTEHGIGFTFNLMEDNNLLNFTRLTRDFQYKYNDTNLQDKRPWSSGARENDGLLVVLYRQFYAWSNKFCKPNAFAVHSPDELPVSVPFSPFGYTQAVDVYITPEIIQTERDLIAIDPDVRNCFFKDERPLQYFNVYTQKNCEMECLSFIGKSSIT